MTLADLKIFRLISRKLDQTNIFGMNDNLFKSQRYGNQLELKIILKYRLIMKDQPSKATKKPKDSDYPKIRVVLEELYRQRPR